MQCECASCECKTVLTAPQGQVRLNSSSSSGLLSPGDWEVKVNDGQRARSVCSGCWDAHYRRAAPVPEKQKYEWANEGMCPSCGIEVLLVEASSATTLEDGRPSSRVIRFAQCPNCGTGFARIEVSDYITIKEEIGIKSKSIEKIRNKPKREVIHKGKANGYQLRYIRSRSDDATVVFQVGWDRGELDHMDCKVCHSEWRKAEGTGVEERFDVTKVDDGYHIRCRNCLSDCSTG